MIVFNAAALTHFYIQIFFLLLNIRWPAKMNTFSQTEACMVSSLFHIHRTLCKHPILDHVSAPHTHSYATAVCSEQAAWRLTWMSHSILFRSPSLCSPILSISTVRRNTGYSKMTIAGFIYVTEGHALTVLSGGWIRNAAYHRIIEANWQISDLRRKSKTIHPPCHGWAGCITDWLTALRH